MDRSVPTFQFGAVTLIPSERVVLKDGRPVPLTPKAFDLLAVLAAHPGRLLTKDELIEAVWPDAVVEESNLTYNVFAIRKALGESADGERYIETVPKRGYRFVAPVAQVGGDQQSIEPAPVPWRAAARRWLHAAIGLAIGATASAFLMQFRGATHPEPAEAIHFEEAAWGQLALTNVTGAWPLFVTSPVFVSPDGRHLAASLAGEDGVRRIWVRRMNELSPKPLPGTETLSPVPSFWSPDGAAIAFDAPAAAR